MTWTNIRLSIVMFLMGLASAYFLIRYKPAQSRATVIRENLPQYQFIKPYIVGNDTNTKPDGPQALQSKLEKVADESKAEGLVTNASVYYRDFNSSTWIGVNENDNYEPSSLIKVITLIAYLKSAEEDSGLLNQKIYYKYNDDPGQHYKPENHLSAGNHTVKELLAEMIINSDQNAMKILNAYRPDMVMQVFKDLELPTPSIVGEDYMSAEIVARIFRVLYNATYLTRGHSEEALKLLSLTNFNNGLAADTPSITISHKFGEHTFVDKNGAVVRRELHDCGIVYYPDHPFVLCVMTKGEDFGKLEKVIQNVAKTVTQFVAKED